MFRLRAGPRALGIIQKEQFHKGYTRFAEIAKLWTEFSTILKKIGQNEEIRLTNVASRILLDIAEKEKQAIEILESI